jgi:hypothetical protein
MGLLTCMQLLLLLLLLLLTVHVCAALVPGMARHCVSVTQQPLSRCAWWWATTTCHRCVERS